MISKAPAGPAVAPLAVVTVTCGKVVAVMRTPEAVVEADNDEDALVDAAEEPAIEAVVEVDKASDPAPVVVVDAVRVEVTEVEALRDDTVVEEVVWITEDVDWVVADVDWATEEVVAERDDVACVELRIVELVRPVVVLCKAEVEVARAVVLPVVVVIRAVVDPPVVLVERVAEVDLMPDVEVARRFRS